MRLALLFQHRSADIPAAQSASCSRERMVLTETQCGLEDNLQSIAPRLQRGSVSAGTGSASVYTES